MKTGTRVCYSVENKEPNKNYSKIRFFSISKYTKTSKIVSPKWRQTNPSKLSSSHDAGGAVAFVGRHRWPCNGFDWSAFPQAVLEGYYWFLFLSVTHREGRVQKRGGGGVRIFRHLPGCSSTYFNSVAVRGENVDKSHLIWTPRWPNLTLSL